ncbi:MAG: hypothetical protein V4456_02445 [Bacteroidota bacterium]
MKLLLTTITFLLAAALRCTAQDTALITQPAAVKTNPIIYGDVGFGFGIAGAKGPQITTSLNHQFKRNLFTFRFVAIADLDLNVISIGPFVALPGIKDNGNLQEYALLYGQRFVTNGHAFSVSLGASANTRVFKFTDSNNQKQRIAEHYIGLPFELNIMWFKTAKRRFRIYHIIPVGKPTGFGGSIGFKFSGNISQHSYAALGLVYGLGYHKHY